MINHSFLVLFGWIFLLSSPQQATYPPRLCGRKVLYDRMCQDQSVSVTHASMVQWKVLPDRLERFGKTRGPSNQKTILMCEGLGMCWCKGWWVFAYWNATADIFGNIFAEKNVWCKDRNGSTANFTGFAGSFPRNRPANSFPFELIWGLRGSIRPAKVKKAGLAAEESEWLKPSNVSDLSDSTSEFPNSTPMPSSRAACREDRTENDELKTPRWSQLCDKPSFIRKENKNREPLFVGGDFITMWLGGCPSLKKKTSLPLLPFALQMQASRAQAFCEWLQMTSPKAQTAKKLEAWNLVWNLILTLKSFVVSLHLKPSLETVCLESFTSEQFNGTFIGNPVPQPTHKTKSNGQDPRFQPKNITMDKILRKQS